MRKPNGPKKARVRPEDLIDDARELAAVHRVTATRLHSILSQVHQFGPEYAAEWCEQVGITCERFDGYWYWELDNRSAATIH